MPQNQGFILDISLVVEVSNKCISIKLQCTSQKIRTHITLPFYRQYIIGGGAAKFVWPGLS